MKVRAPIFAAILGVAAFSGAAQAKTIVETYSGSVIHYIVPVAGVYDITAFGAQGGTGADGYIGGLGAEIGGDIRLAAGSSLAILVGGIGGDGLFLNGDEGGGGGGGGTFVVLGADPLVVAGGGGGGGGRIFFGDNEEGQTGTSGANGFGPSGNGVGGSGGSGGSSDMSPPGGGGGGGGGLTGSGLTNIRGFGGGGGASFLTGGRGGFSGFGGGGAGGFGGGGGGALFYSGGGGGGYSGGGGAFPGGYDGGGGGSFFTALGSQSVAAAGENPGYGLVDITLLSSVPEPAVWIVMLCGMSGIGCILRRRHGPWPPKGAGRPSVLGRSLAITVRAASRFEFRRDLQNAARSVGSGNWAFAPSALKRLNVR